MSDVERDMRQELYLSLLLLGADPILLGNAASWANGAADEEVLADLRNWNAAKVLELKEWLPTMSGEQLDAAQHRIAQYESQSRSLKKAA
jgi:hypothetical protein